jgi:hypothetical protein
MNLPETAYGWSFVFSLFFTIWLVRQTLVKWRREEKQKSGKDEGIDCLSVGLLTLILGSLTFLFFPFVVMFFETNYQYATLPQFESTIVAVESKWEKQEYTDTDKRRQTRDVLMHTSIVEFANADGKTVRLPSNIRSGEEPIIGDKLRVAYASGMQTAAEVSFRAFALQFGLLVMLLILGFCLLMITRWVLGKNNEKLASLGINTMLTVGVPLAMIGMEAGFIYGLMRHFSGEKDFPMWVVGLLIFFVIALGLGIIGYLMSLWQGYQEDKKLRK